MITVPCPWCGPRNASEFASQGETRARPDPATATPERWRAYLYLARNPAGAITETWYHRAGCRRFFVVERDTVTGAVASARAPGSEGRESARRPESAQGAELAQGAESGRRPDEGRGQAG